MSSTKKKIITKKKVSNSIPSEISPIKENDMNIFNANPIKFNRKSTPYISMKSVPNFAELDFKIQGPAKCISNVIKMDLAPINMDNKDLILKFLEISHTPLSHYLKKRKRALPLIDKIQLQRIKIMNFHQQGKSYQEIGNILRISRQKVRNIIKSITKSNILAKTKPGPKKKISPAQENDIEQYLNDSSNAIKPLHDLKDFMEEKYKSLEKKFSLPTLHRTIKKMRYSRKKTIPDYKIKNTPEIKQKRYEVSRILLNLLYQNSNIIFLDETGCSFNVFPRYGYAKRKKKNIINNPQPSKNYSVLMAINKWGILGFMVFEGGIRSQEFVGYMFELIKNNIETYPNKSACFFLDNAPIHKSKLTTENFIQSHSTLFNAPYSPQMNPIELVFSVIKREIRNLRPKNLKELIESIFKSCKKITAKHIRSFMYSSIKFCKKALNYEDFY